MNPKRAAERAVELFEGNWNCAEAVFQAIYEQVSGDEPPSYLLTALGGGLGSRRTCGALTGAAVALGLKYGRTEPEQAKTPAYAASERLCEGFAAKLGATDCEEVTCWTCDDAIRHRKCAEAVWTAARMAGEILKEAEGLDGAAEADFA